MTTLRKYAAATIALLVLSLSMTACSSDSEGDVAGGTARGSGGQATAGESGLMLDTPEYKLTQEFPLALELTSTVFTKIRRIPIEYTCTDNYYYPEAALEFRYGEDKSPPLAWTGAPEGTQSFALISDDPDAVEFELGVLSPRVHWLIWNIPAEGTELAERVATTTDVLAIGPNTRQGINDFSQIGWSGPCPPPNIMSVSQHLSDSQKLQKTQYPHAYRFTVYALDTELDLAAGANKNDLLAAMDGHILAGGELIGEYVNKRLFK
jgi:Raf kinase inhibitor-like YbhB/YbcL family protein